MIDKDVHRQLVDHIDGDKLRGLRWPELRQGEVIAVDYSVNPITCSIFLSGDGDTSVDGVPCLEPYVPLVGDIPFLLMNGSDLIAVGPVTKGPVETTTGLSAASGWSTTQFLGRKSGGVTFVLVRMDRTGGTITVTNQNITDTLLCTLPAGWRPPDTIFPVCNLQNSRHGVMEVTAAGACNLVTASSDIILGDSAKFYASWVDWGA